jgi:hypothetical protein|tara:strand:- start:2129 stop:3136 length:1008 start_codon:yes stop_codon:yes gene_type:complete
MNLKKYNKCVYCGSQNLKKEKKQYFIKNFYVRAIISDLNLSNKEFQKIKVYRCTSCYILQNNPWFSETISRKIYSNIYGQHNRGWTNLLNFIKRGIKPDHGSLFEILNKKIHIKNYAEFNSPFTGIMINFFSNEYKKNIIFYKSFFKNILRYLTSRQVAGRSKEYQKLSIKKSKYFFDKIKVIKTRNLIKKNINKYLFVDDSGLSWGQNDNYKSVNSKSLATEFFDLKIADIKDKNRKIKIDLFGIFHTLDHTFEPNKILNFALDVSKYVVVYCHVDPKLNRQHLFSLTKEFLKHLNMKKIYTLDLTDKIEKKYKSPELYFLCSKEKKYMNKIKI